MSWSVSITPDQAQYRPRHEVGLVLHVSGPPDGVAKVVVSVSSLERTLTTLQVAIVLDGSGVADRVVRFELPPGGPSWQAFGADVQVVDSGGEMQATASTAFDVARHWEVAPRYGFLADFGPETTDSDDAARLRDMRALHLNCIQFYD